MTEPTSGEILPNENEDDKRAREERAEFEAALNAQQAPGKRFEVGELVTGKVAGVQEDALLVSFGGKSEIVLQKGEGDTEVKVGDTIEAVVMSVSPELKLSRGVAAERRSAAELREAFEARLPVEGKVIARNKGGFHVSIGRVGAFCPASQIDIGQKDPDSFLEQSFPFRIIEYQEGGRRIVVSRAVLLREEKDRRLEEIRSKLVVGGIFEGTVTSVMDYGAFVDLGGVEGLVHVSELSRRRVAHPREVVATGQRVQVKITKMEADGKRISLSMREFEKDPWIEAAERFGSGATFSGKILRKADFGFFVELEPGLEGLLHNSQLPPGISKDDPSLAVGESIRGWVREIDPGKRRISLALREVATGDPWAEAPTRFREGLVVEGQLERMAPFGLFVLLEPGLTGLVPLSETGTPPGTDLARTFSLGQKLVVRVMSVDPVKKRISLSIQGAKDEAARSEYREYAEKAAGDGAAAGVTAFAAAFARAKEKKK